MTTPVTTPALFDHAAPIAWRKPEQLRVHPAVADLPELADDDADFAGLVADFRAGRMLPIPLLVTPDDRILDGRHRWRAARVAHCPEVPVIVMPCPDDGAALDIALKTLARRRHYRAGQLAFLAYPRLESAHAAAAKAAAEAMRTGDLAGRPKLRTVEEMAEGLGISRGTFFLAAKLFAIFADTDKLSLTWSPQVLDAAGLAGRKKWTPRQVFGPQIMRKESPIGLGPAIAGAQARIEQHLAETSGRKHGGGRPAEAAGQLALFSAVWSRDLKTRYEYWTRFDEEQKAAAEAAIGASLAAAPDDFVARLKKRVDAEARKRQREE